MEFPTVQQSGAQPDSDPGGGLSGELDRVRFPKVHYRWPLVQSHSGNHRVAPSALESDQRVGRMVTPAGRFAIHRTKLVRFQHAHTFPNSRPSIEASETRGCWTLDQPAELSTNHPSGRVCVTRGKSSAEDGEGGRTRGVWSFNPGLDLR